MPSAIPRFLADTWWYGLTDRLSDVEFENLAVLRKSQGFTAVQLVMGIPPEVGPLNSAARGGGDAAWDLAGNINRAYVTQAVSRLTTLSRLALQPIIYGAWGEQVEWLGAGKMEKWWGRIVDETEHLGPIYCLTGEADIRLKNPGALLLGKSTDDLLRTKLLQAMPLSSLLMRMKPGTGSALKNRAEKWGEVLTPLSAKPGQPILCHTTPAISSRQATSWPEKLAATTVQTGHDQASRYSLLHLPLEAGAGPKHPFINLEPWYEGIRQSFGIEDQLYAYWVSALAGASAFCYGAQGIWNAGDGQFMGHWGTQTFQQAQALHTPRLLGASHRLLAAWDGVLEQGTTTFREGGNKLELVTRTLGDESISYVPDITQLSEIIPTDETIQIYDPLSGQAADQLPASGPVVILRRPAAGRP